MFIWFRRRHHIRILECQIALFFDDKQDTTLGGRVFQAREAASLSVTQVVNRLGVD